MASHKYSARFLRGPFDGEYLDFYERPTHGQSIMLQRKRGIAAALYRWSDALGAWVFEKHVLKSDFVEVKPK